jgi:hypothetical protein
MFVCCECLCCQVEVSATGWSLIQRSPTDCGASLCVRSRNLENKEAKARYRAVKIQPQWVVTPRKQQEVFIAVKVQMGCLVGCNTVYCGGWLETFCIYMWPPCPEGQCHHPENHILKTYMLVISS